uniref:UBX domain-containing protein 6 n=1 Tax=Oncorhynchus mykiss TaxID=8022 RepID=A0A8K9Y4E6_ONCMY
MQTLVSLANKPYNFIHHSMQCKCSQMVNMSPSVPCSSKPRVVQNSGPARPHHAAPTEGAQKAGAAAMARIEGQPRPRAQTSQDAIRLQGERFLCIQQLMCRLLQGSSVKDPAFLSVTGVYFTCPLTGATLTKSEREVHIKEAIFMRFEEDAVEASIMMVHTFNKDREKVKAAVDIISKYIENICKNPTEEKYRKIKLSNKVFQEKVKTVEGSREFLQAVGFQSIMLDVEGQEESEEFLVLMEHDPEALEVMKDSMDRLQRGEPVRAQLDHQPQTFRPSPNAMRFELPPEFYNLTAEELKREQQQKSEAVEKNTMLRTKAMREREEQRERRKYNYTLLRIRLPDGNILQGTFLAWDKVSVLFQFVRDSLVDGWQPFELVAPGGHKLREAQELALNECSLVPAVLLTFSWDAAVQADISAALLKPVLLKNIQTLG